MLSDTKGGARAVEMENPEGLVDQESAGSVGSSYYADEKEAALKRHKMSRRKSRRSFSRGASHVHKKNLHSGSSMMQRGGIRL